MRSVGYMKVKWILACLIVGLLLAALGVLSFVNLSGISITVVPQAPVPGHSEVSVKATVKNAGFVPKDIGTNGNCGVHGLNDWITDNSAIAIMSGLQSCLMSLPAEGMGDVVLWPGQSYTQELTISLTNAKARQTITFRAGLENPLHFVV